MADLINVGTAPNDGTGDTLREGGQALNLHYSEQALTFSSTIAWNLETHPLARVTLTGNATINASGINDGRSGYLAVTQDGTGGHALTFGTGFAAGNGGALPQVADGAGETTVIFYVVTGGAVLITDASGGGSVSGGQFHIADGVPGALSTGTIHMSLVPADLTLQSAAATVGTAPSSGPVTLQVVRNGTTEATVTIADGQTESTDSGFPVPYEQDDELDLVLTAVNSAEDLRYRLLGIIGFGAVHPTISGYIATVVGAGGTISSEEESNLNEFWLRLSNRDMELSGDLTASVVGCWTLRNTQNTASGSVLKGIVGGDLTRGGTTDPTFGADGMVFEDGYLTKGSALLPGNTGAVTLFTVARRTGTTGTSQYIAGQITTGTTGRTAWCYMQESDSFLLRDGHANASGFKSAQSASAYWTANDRKAAGLLIHPSANLVAVYNGAGTDLTGTVGPTNISNSTGYENTPLLIGNKADEASPLVGDISIILFIQGNAAANIGAITTIYKETIGQGLGL